MKILILGGTRFLGRYLVESALQHGHEVTLFNRGRSAPDAFPDVEQLVGDRDGQLQALEGRTWDAVIDTCGFYPSHVRQTAELLKDNVRHYTFISSGSVYADLTRVNFDESAPLATMPAEIVEEVTRADGARSEYYGALKALCEEALEEVMPGRALHIRSGLIVGPHDNTDRFKYWPARFARGGEVLVPAPDRQLQVIDVRDEADWIIRLAEENVTGVFNCSGATSTLGELFAACQDVAQSGATVTWVDETFLKEQEVGVWIELPLWIPQDDAVGMFAMNNDKAFAHGLVCRPIADTVRATLEWDRTRASDAERKAGLSPDKEKAVLKAWHEWA
jgi:2'-hydroxyisoflavone reductase